MLVRGLETACMIILLIISFLLPQLSESINFQITNFVPDANDILYSGDAVPSASGAIELNNRPDRSFRVGHATYADAVQIWDTKSGKLSDFITHFTFVTDTVNRSSYGDGFAFFLAPVGFQIPPNSAGEFLGLFNTTNYDSPQNQIIFVEFDSYGNSRDPPYGHVGINIRSLFHSVNNTPWNASLHSGDSADVWVSYNATTHILSLSLSYVAENITSPGGNTTLSYKVDLIDILPDWVTIGFSGATGRLVERHIIQYWEFSSSLNTLQERDQDNSNTKRKLAVGLAVPIGVVGCIVAFALCFWRRQRNPTHDESVLETSANDDFERATGPKRFSFRDLALATNNFSDDLKLGEGGFGCVYKGYLTREGILVAVKKISQGSKQGKKEYMTEVKIINSLRHRNLVQLIGWCHEETQFLLVYEFMPNGSLDSHLFYKKSVLEWQVRYNIVIGLASSLFYLHEECEQCVLHRDIKTSNIMLDSGFNAKLGDFGLARLIDHELSLKTTGSAGTVGYMAPEYATKGKASKESDVYSFGVVALEIACGQKATDKVDPNSDFGLVEWVWGLLEKGELLSGVDQELNLEFKAKEVECLMMVGLWCSHNDRSLRPSIRQAIQALKFEGAIPNILSTKILMSMPISHAPVLYDAQQTSSSATMTNSSTDLAR